MQRYIESINNNEITDETQYKLVTFNILQGDKTYIDFLDACIRYHPTSKPTMPQDIKMFFNKLKSEGYITTFDKLKSVIDFIENNSASFDPAMITDQYTTFRDIVITWRKCIPYLKDSMTDFVHLNSEMQKMKNHIGYMCRGKLVSSLVNNRINA
jgi:hypothetical protein